MGPSSLCIFSGFWIFFNGCFSIYLMTSISVERYLLIFHGLKHKYSRRMILVSFFMGVLWPILPLLGWSRYSLTPTSCEIDYRRRTLSSISYNIALFTSSFFLPLGIMSFTTTAFLLKVSKFIL